MSTNICSIDECNLPVYGNTYCRRHNYKYKKYGDPFMGRSVELHGMYDSGEYSTWRSMKSRCNNPKNRRYRDYGGRGIKVCKQWQDSFTNFYRDMGSRPQGFSIDRIDNDGDYTPENCKWSDTTEQATNKRIRKDNQYRVRGVTYDKVTGRYALRVYVNKKCIWGGRHDTLQEATDKRLAILESLNICK